MQYLPLGLTAYDDNAYGLPPVVLENWFMEQAPERPDRPGRLLPAPGLASFATGLDGAVLEIFQADGIQSGKMFVAAGTKIQSITSGGTVADVGTVAGMTRARFAASQSDLVVAAGGSAYVVTSSLSAAITVGASTGDITDVAEIDQIHLFLEDGTGRFWWSDPADPTTVQATSFATAESEPDNLLAIRAFNGTVLLFGTQSTEGWFYTGSDGSPFLPRPGFKVKRGIIGRDAVAEADLDLFAVGDDGAVYRFAGGQPQNVGTNAIERLIADVAVADRGSIKLTAHKQDKHTFIALHLPSVGDYVYDTATGAWHRRKEIGSVRYLCDVFGYAWGRWYAGDRSTGNVYRLDRETYTHNGATVRRVAQALFPVEDGRPAISSLVAEIQAGVGLVSGQGQDPQIMLRHSTNGRTWSNEVSRTFGREGEYNHVARFDSLGRFRPPVGAIEIAVSDPVPATVTGLKANMSRA